MIHLDITNYDLALEYFDKALHICEKLGIENDILTGILWLRIAGVNLGKKNYNQAIKDNQKALNIFQSQKQQQYYTANAYSLNANIYQALNQVDSALFYLDKGLKLHQTIGANLLILKDQILLATLISPTEVNKAIEIGEEVLKKAGDYKDHTMKINLYKLLYKCYKKKKNNTLALTMLENYNRYADSLHIEQNHIAFTKKVIQTEYEAKMFKTQLENEQTQSQLKLKQLKNTYAILFLGCLLYTSPSPRD